MEQGKTNLKHKNNYNQIIDNSLLPTKTLVDQWLKYNFQSFTLLIHTNIISETKRCLLTA